MAWGKLAALLPGLLIKGIQVAEAVITAKQAGSRKKDLVKQMVLFGVEVAELVKGKELLADPEVASAFDAANDALVHLQNAIQRAEAARTGGSGT